MIGVFLSLGLVGYSAGLQRRRSPLIAIVLVISLGATMWLVVDLDRPADGLLQTSQQALIDLQEKLESSSRDALPTTGPPTPYGEGLTAAASSLTHRLRRSTAPMAGRTKPQPIRSEMKNAKTG